MQQTDVTSFEISLNVDEPCTQAPRGRQHWQQDTRSEGDVPSLAPLEH